MILVGDRRYILTSLLILLLLAQGVFALSFVGFTDKFNYKINRTINYTGSSDQNLTSNITIYLINSSESLFSFSSIVPNNTNFTVQLNASVAKSGDYIAKANFTFNGTYYESSSIVKISKGHSIVISTNKPAYSPGETINFTVTATNVNNIGISDENVTVRLLYSTNDTVLSTSTGITNSAGEYKGTFTAPSALGSYRLTVNQWVATKVIDVSTFDLVAFTGDSNGNIKTKFASGDTAYVYMDLFDSNKTRYSGTETLSVQVTYPNGTQNASVSYAFFGSRLNTSFVVSDQGSYEVKVTVVSNSKSVTLPFVVSKYELVGWLERNTTQTTDFFPNEAVNIRVKVFNISTGTVIKTAGLDYAIDIVLLDSAFTNVSAISNTSTLDTATGVRTFSFNSSNTTGLYYVKVSLNQTQVLLEIKVIDTIATAIPVDQSYNFKNVFVGNKQIIRIITILSNSTSSINATNISAVSVKNFRGIDVTSLITVNRSIVDYKGVKAGLLEFSALPDAGIYFIKTLANDNFAGEAQFLIKFYTACAQLDGYKWFISSSEDANLTVRVAEAKDISIIDSLAGNSSDSGNAGGNFSSMFGVYDCYSEYRTTASGSSTAGNNTANVKVSVTKIINTLNGEDVTTKVANLPSNNTDNNGRVILTLTKPSGGWSSGTYVVELELRDQNNNTDKGFGSFQVKNLWINVWPKQVSGRWKWYFSPNENMTFDVNAYNSTGTWYYYGQNNGVGDNCYVLDVFYQGNGAEWFWPPKPIATTKYSATCINNTSPANGRFTLNMTPLSSFDPGYYMVRVKVNTTAGVGDVGEGWYSIKAYNVYIRTTSNNYYDSWYRGVTDNVSLDVDVTYTNSTRWECYWQKCPSSELVLEPLNITVKLIRYDGSGTDYSITKYNSVLANSTSTTITAYTLSTFNNSATILNISANVTNSSVYINIPKNATINSAFVGVNSTSGNYNFTATLYDFNNNSVTPRLAFNITTINTTMSNVSFSNALTTLLSSCTSVSSNCTLGFNVTLNSSGTATFSNLLVNYNLTTSTATTTTFSTINTTSGNVNLTLVPKGGPNNNSWETGYYSIFVIVNGPEGKETGTYWFEIRSFFVNLQTVKSNLQSTYTYSSGQNITLNVSATNKPSWLSSSYGVSLTNVVANITAIKLTYWDQTTYQTVKFPVTWTPSIINGTTVVNITPSLALISGNNWYNLEVTMTDNSGNNQTGWASFQVKDYTFYATTNKWEYTNAENITINVAVCDGDTWWCNFYSNPYSGAAVNVTVNKLMRTETWPYSDVSGWNASVARLNSTTNNATGNITLIPSSSLAGGYYSAELSSRYVSGSGSPLTQTVWFRIKSFSLSAYATKWEYSMSENVSLSITTSSSATLSDASITCGYWPSQTVYSLSGGTLSANSTSLSGTKTIMLSPRNSNWVSGYCYGNLVVTSGGETQYAYTSFNMKAFTLYSSSPKYQYLKNESIALILTSDSGQQFNVTSLNISYYNYENGTNVVLRLGQDFTTNATNRTLSTGAAINITPVGNWSFKGYYSGQLEAIDSANSRIAQIVWIYFEIRDTLYSYGWPVYLSTGNSTTYYNYNTSSENITMIIYTLKYNSSKTDYWPYDAIGGVNLTIASIQKQSCATYPCTYSNVTGWTANTAISQIYGTGPSWNRSAYALMNITRSGGWTSGWHYLNINAVENSTGEATSFNKQMGFWVNT